MSKKSAGARLAGWFVVLNGAAQGKALPLYEGKSQIGGSPDHEVSLPFDELWTRRSDLRHCATDVAALVDVEVSAEGDEALYVLKDGGARPLLNDEGEISQEELVEGDIVTIGSVRLGFQSLRLDWWRSEAPA